MHFIRTVGSFIDEVGQDGCDSVEKREIKISRKLAKKQSRQSIYLLIYIEVSGETKKLHSDDDTEILVTQSDRICDRIENQCHCRVKFINRFDMSVLCVRTLHAMGVRLCRCLHTFRLRDDVRGKYIE